MTQEVQRLSQSVASWNKGIILGIVLTAIAAATLVVIQYMAFRESKRLLDAQDQLLKAKDARVADDLSEKDELIESAKVQTEELALEVVQAQEAIATAREREKKAYMELFHTKEQVKPRRLTSTQRAKLVSQLSHGEKGEIRIAFLNGNVESQDFALDIARVLKDSGWTVNALDSRNVIGQFPLGLRLIMHDEFIPRTATLRSAFQSIGLAVEAKSRPILAFDAVELFVGEKP